jgi:hypothetical protein
MPLKVRLLTPDDMPTLERLYRRDPLRFLTPRMNLEVYGFGGEVVQGWGAFTPDETEIEGVLLRYSNTVIVTDIDGAAASAFAPVIDNENGVAGVRGTIETVRRVRANLRRYTANGLEQSTFMQLRIPPHCPPEILRLARRARPDDLDKLATLYSGAYTMFRTRANVAAKLAETRVFVVEEPPGARQSLRIASCALLNMEGTDAGLIGGVFTSAGARGRGYASACTAALSLDLQRDNKLPCLFYENPVAGRLYRRLGFEDAGQWAVLYLNPPK